MVLSILNSIIRPAVRKRRILAALLFGLIFLLPIGKVKVMPEWPIQFVEENGEAARNQRIEQTWRDYSKQWFSVGSETDDTAMTDQNGFIVLPERHVRVSLLEYLLGSLKDVSPRLPWGSYGTSSIVICRDNTSCSAWYREGEALPNLVVVKR
jgi:hypothetical protein